MKRVRLGISLAVTLVIVGGYAAGQAMYLLGPDSVPEFEAKVNDPRVHVLMLILLVAAIALGFIPDREDTGT
jgi:hypothetical protein